MDRPRQDSAASAAAIQAIVRKDSAISLSSIHEKSPVGTAKVLPSINEGFPVFQDTGPRLPLIQLPRLVARQVAPKFTPTKDTVIKLDGRPLKTYQIDKIKYTFMEGIHENEAGYERRTKDGRRLRFHLEVLQQPMRARACGSGPRSSADRRPVDPPPVVKLKVTCGEVGAEQDITMNFESQLIIFTTLEVARPIANGRMYAQNHRPVLTGTCAAGTSHLEKPFPAAYFIFPDLSVRHEGWYNLRFSLFEKITNEADRGVDEHRETIQQHEDKHSPSVWDGLVNRMEVRTSKFQVYSAKKFPGLKGSTELSRLIADQGCRVRIRREVRQRKRPTKEGAEEDEDRVSAEQTPTPSDAARSISRNSQTGSTYFQNFPDRRYSNESSYAQQNALAPMRPPQSPAERSNSWGTWTPAPSSIVSTFNMPPPAAKLQRPSYSSYESNSSNNTTISLPPLSHLDVRNTINNTIGTNPAGLYNIPEIAPAQKRGYSPHSSTYIDQSAPIKDGARPDMVPLQQPMPFKPAEPKFGGGQGLGQGIMEADSDEETSDSDDLLSGDYTYKRADGRRGNKVVPHLMHYKSR